MVTLSKLNPCQLEAASSNHLAHCELVQLCSGVNSLRNMRIWINKCIRLLKSSKELILIVRVTYEQVNSFVIIYGHICPFLLILI